MKYSVVIPTFQRPEMLFRCLRSIDLALNNVDFAADIDVLVGINGDRNSYESLKHQDFVFNLIIHEFKTKRNPSAVRNDLVSLSNSDFYLFIDDDVEVSDTYITNSLSTLEQGEVDILGGFDQGFSNVNYIEKMVNIAITSPFVTAFTRKRHTQCEDGTYSCNEEGLTLSNLWVSAKVFKSNISFNQVFKRNEENILIQEAILSGFTVKRSSELFVFHHRRNKINNFFLPSFYSGYYRVNALWSYSRLFNILYLIPAFTLLYTLIIATVGLWQGFAFHIVYILFALVFSLLQISKISALDVLPLLLVQIILITSYAFGQLYSLFTLNFMRVKDVQSA